jgi:hypothetical protein
MRLRIILSAENFNEHLASIGFSSIDPKASPDLWVLIASKLLAKGASGNPLHEGLIHAVKRDHVEAVNLLLAGNGYSKASVDYREAAVLKDAVAREKIHLVKRLLASDPKPSSTSGAFPNIWKYQKEGRLVLAQELLSHGATGLHVDEGLVLALEDRGPTRDQRLIKVLVQGGADLGFRDGRAIELATQLFDLPALEILLAEKPSVSF